MAKEVVIDMPDPEKPWLNQPLYEEELPQDKPWLNQPLASTYQETPHDEETYRSTVDELAGRNEWINRLNAVGRGYGDLGFLGYLEEANALGQTIRQAAKPVIGDSPFLAPIRLGSRIKDSVMNDKPFFPEGGGLLANLPELYRQNLSKEEAITQAVREQSPGVYLGSKYLPPVVGGLLATTRIPYVGKPAAGLLSGYLANEGVDVATGVNFKDEALRWIEDIFGRTPTSQ